jgi:hypothetical protein
VSDTGARLLHPCIRINRILRAMLTERALERGGAAAGQNELKRALALRSEIRRAGWFN